MISSYKDYCHYIECDRIASKRTRSFFDRTFLSLFLTRDLIWTFQKLLRLHEYHLNCNRGVMGLFTKYLVHYRFRVLSVRLGYTIPPNVFGPGLSIAHRGTIVINSNARIGNNCRIHIDVNIGAVGKSSQAPMIGNNVYIGPGAKIFGDIKIGNNSLIGANAVVNKSFEEGNVVIGGVPAKVIGVSNVDDHLIRATDIIG